MTHRVLKFAVFLSVVFCIVSFWDHPFFSFTKEFFVLIHEICHAIAALIAGCDVKYIQIHGNESGETVTSLPMHKGASLFIISAGYIGTALTGGLLLYKGFRGEGTRISLILFGAIVLLITLKYSEKGSLTFQVGTMGSLIVFISVFFGRFLSSFVLVFIGTSLCLYSLYDLRDFAENIHKTDAGILAYYLTGYDPGRNEKIPHSVLLLGHLIGITWSLICLSVIYKFVFHSFSESAEPTLEEERFASFNEETLAMFPGELTPEVLDWFLSKELDLYGNPISPPSQELMDGFAKDSEMT